MKKNNYSGIISILLMLFIGFMSANLAKAAQPFAYGADIGWVKQLEDRGVSWRDDAGTPRDVLQILRDHGINAVRLRIFVNPDPSALWHKDNTTWTMLGYTDKPAWWMPRSAPKRWECASWWISTTVMFSRIRAIK